MCQLNEQGVFRIIDANFNRAKEGLRVCEDICRFVLDDKVATKNLKSYRHELTDIIICLSLGDIIQSRNVVKDVGKKSQIGEFKRTRMADIFYANAQRVKESIRVLEELMKLFNRKAAEQLKKIRYKIYAIEQRITKKF